MILQDTLDLKFTLLNLRNTVVFYKFYDSENALMISWVIDYEITTTNNFFVNVHQWIRGEFYFHHSHITGRIYGYAHDFCNTTQLERSIAEIPFIALNFLGFDLFYYLKAYIAPAWCSKAVDIGGLNLTHTNFGNITGEIKLIDSLKFYEKTLGEISSTLTSEEKIAVKKLTEKFLNQYYYIIPYEIIVDMESIFIKPDSEFWAKSEFFSELKQSAVNDQDYEHSKFLYQTFKMRNLGDVNDLYNTQDVILLTEIIESRFQAMQNTYGFNPRKCNSASSMSGSIEREMSKIILALPTKYEHVEIFEETVIGGFSCVNTRLAFDTQILLPNLPDKNNLEENPMNKDFNYKVFYNLKINNEKTKKRVITKILKLDENNQYGHGMTKPLYYRLQIMMKFLGKHLTFY